MYIHAFVEYKLRIAAIRYYRLSSKCIENLENNPVESANPTVSRTQRSQVAGKLH